ncbi:MAG TPA: sialate O-acetylesterase [Pseudobacteroides sp.]|uniref:sialate O-acetylesterase n=1 Tax=Pseudobacteroides sp. TaxID=1968840 RepID=UPI002F92BDF9
MKVTGSRTVTVKDILFGEVWFCAGQSNMAMQLPFAGNGTVEAANANYPNIRYFSTPYQSTSESQPVFGYVSNWTLCTPNSVGNLTAVGYFFARKLSQDLDVPVGIICSAVGGSFIESWIGNEAYKAFLASPEAAGFQASSPNGFYNGMVSPIMPFNIKGIMWYQGESNTQFDYLYKKMLTTMITDWRKNYGIGDIPFMVVQLPGYQKIQAAPVETAPYAVIMA